MASSKSRVWDYMQKSITDKGTFAKCLVKLQDSDQICGKLLASNGGNTTGAKNHLKTHNIIIDTAKRKDFESSPRQSKLAINHDKTTLEMILARSAAIEGLSINAITNSELVASQAKRHGFDVPKCNKTVRKLILQFADTISSNYRDEFKELKNKGTRFSITTDGWTNCANLMRFINVTVQSNEALFNLGLIGFRGSTSHREHLRLVNERLNKFGLSSSDIVATTQDGESMMVRYAEESGFEYQICLNHGLHLAICAVLYTSMQVDRNDNDDDDDDDDDDIEDDDDDEPSNDERMFANMQQHFEVDNSERQPAMLVTDLKDSIRSARKIVKFFKRSAVRNDRLQEFVVSEEGRRLNLVLDVRTRWNSLLSMCRRLVRLRQPIEAVLSEFGVETLLAPDLFDHLAKICEALSTHEEVVLLLSKKHCNLLEADASMKYIIARLQSQNCTLAEQLLEAIRSKMLSRRNVPLASLLLILIFSTKVTLT